MSDAVSENAIRDEFDASVVVVEYVDVGTAIVVVVVAVVAAAAVDTIFIGDTFAAGN